MDRKEGKENHPSEPYTPRQYQLDLAERAVANNTIIPLKTGSGKTLIAVLVLKSLSDPLLKPLAEGGRRSVFIVDKIFLVKQQSAYIRKHTSLKVAELQGSSNTDFYDRATWKSFMQNYSVFVVIAQIFCDGLNHGFVSMEQFNLLIFDECHHATGNHPYCVVMDHYLRCPVGKRPRVVGLTASVLNKHVSLSSAMLQFSCLEKTLCSRIDASSWYLTVSAYSAQPTVQIIPYDSTSVSSEWSKICSDIANSFENVRHIIAQCKSAVSSENRETLKDVSRMLSLILHVNEELGLWCSLTACKDHLEEMTKLGRGSVNQTQLAFIAMGLTQLRYAIRLLENGMRKMPTPDDFSVLVSPKVLRILEILKDQNEFSRIPNDGQTMGEDRFCGIVFVQRRYTASILTKLLHYVKSCKPSEYCNLKFDFVVGANNKNDTASCRSQYGGQEEVLLNFRNGRLNLITATDVLEEGFDLQNCNFVIRFHPPISFRSFIQSKGRARKVGSKYLILTDRIEWAKTSNLLKSFLEIETQLMNYESTTNYEESDHEFAVKDNTYLAPYYNTFIDRDGIRRTARITLSSALRLLNTYCQKLPYTGAVPQQPKYKLFSVIDTVGIAKFQCKIRLPKNAVVKHEVVGDLMPNRDLAKMAAALRTCELLHKDGGLNDHLLPFDMKDLKDTLNAEE